MLGTNYARDECASTIVVMATARYTFENKIRCAVPLQSWNKSRFSLVWRMSHRSMSLGISSVNRCFADVTLLDVTLCLVRFFHIADVTLLDVSLCLVGKPLFRGMTVFDLLVYNFLLRGTRE